jgi:hypothetical protein
MNIEEVKHNLENGIMVCKPTLLKLAQAASLMEDHLIEVKASERDGGDAAQLLDVINKL